MNCTIACVVAGLVTMSSSDASSTRRGYMSASCSSMC